MGDVVLARRGVEDRAGGAVEDPVDTLEAAGRGHDGAEEPEPPGRLPGRRRETDVESPSLQDVGGKGSDLAAGLVVEGVARDPLKEERLERGSLRARRRIRAASEADLLADGAADADIPAAEAVAGRRL